MEDLIKNIYAFNKDCLNKLHLTNYYNYILNNKYIITPEGGLFELPLTGRLYMDSRFFTKYKEFFEYLDNKTKHTELKNSDYFHKFIFLLGIKEVKYEKENKEITDLEKFFLYHYIQKGNFKLISNSLAKNYFSWNTDIIGILGITLTFFALCVPFMNYYNMWPFVISCSICLIIYSCISFIYPRKRNTYLKLLKNPPKTFNDLKNSNFSFYLDDCFKDNYTYKFLNNIYLNTKKNNIY